MGISLHTLTLYTGFVQTVTLVARVVEPLPAFAKKRGPGCHRIGRLAAEPEIIAQETQHDESLVAATQDAEL